MKMNEKATPKTGRIVARRSKLKSKSKSDAKHTHTVTVTLLITETRSKERRNGERLTKSVRRSIPVFRLREVSRD